MIVKIFIWIEGFEWFELLGEGSVGPVGWYIVGGGIDVVGGDFCLIGGDGLVDVAFEVFSVA